MTARDRIMNAIRRQAAGRPSRAPEAVEARLAAPTQHAPTPSIATTDGEARIDRFAAQAEAVQATVSRIAGMADLPAALADELRRRNLGPAVRMGEEPDFASLDWSGLDVSRGAGRFEEPATLSRAIGGVAETGTSMLLSGPDNPVTLTFLGETHFIVLRRSEIVAGLDDAWTRLRAAGRDPRTVNFVTGPSRSGDIDQTLELGAHGPVASHIFIVDD